MGCGVAKEDKVEFEGEVIEALPNAMFRVKLDNDHVVLGHVAGKPRRQDAKPRQPEPRHPIGMRESPSVRRSNPRTPQGSEARLGGDAAGFHPP